MITCKINPHSKTAKKAVIFLVSGSGKININPCICNPHGGQIPHVVDYKRHNQGFFFRSRLWEVIPIHFNIFVVYGIKLVKLLKHFSESPSVLIILSIPQTPKL